MLVRLLLEYSCAVWDTYLHKDIESVQSLACKICIKNWPASYSDHLCLPTTCDCRIFLKPYTMYKISNNSFSFPESIIDFVQNKVYPSCFITNSQVYGMTFPHLLHLIDALLFLHMLSSISWFNPEGGTAVFFFMQWCMMCINFIVPTQACLQLSKI